MGTLACWGILINWLAYILYSIGAFPALTNKLLYCAMLLLDNVFIVVSVAE